MSLAGAQVRFISPNRNLNMLRGGSDPVCIHGS
jgi:hypothetical protein